MNTIKTYQDPNNKYLFGINFTGETYIGFNSDDGIVTNRINASPDEVEMFIDKMYSTDIDDYEIDDFVESHFSINNNTPSEFRRQTIKYCH